jgi:hypothetical protein
VEVMMVVLVVVAGEADEAGEAGAVKKQEWQGGLGFFEGDITRRW